MKPDISEFSYGYALTEELTKLQSIKAAPEFPSLYQEGQKGGGYDVIIEYWGCPLFIQFKRSYPMVGRSAIEFKKGLLNLPYYRMYLRPLKHSIQHNLLLRLEQKGNEVFYATPKFHTSTELNASYLNKTVLRNSILISPGQIGSLPDDNEHYVAFNPSSKTGYLCSEPVLIELEDAPAIIEQLPAILRNSNRTQRIDQEYVLSIGDELLNVYAASPHLEEYNYLLDIPDFLPRRAAGDRPWKQIGIETEIENLRNLRRLRDRVEPHQYAHYISRNLYECELFLAISR